MWVWGSEGLGVSVCLWGSVSGGPCGGLTEAEGAGQTSDDGHGVLGVGAELQQNRRE